MRLIDVDAFRAEFALAERCEDCPRRNKKDCDYQSYSARDFCGWLDDFPTVGGWISVKERLPQGYGPYLCWFGDYPIGGFCDVVHFNPKKEAFWLYEDNKPVSFITHWMPLPEPPEEDT